MTISRRLFLRSVPPAVAVGTVVAAPVVVQAVEPKKSRHEQALWHMRELERLTNEDGGERVSVIVLADYYRDDELIIKGIHHHPERFRDVDGMFRNEGGEA